MEELSAELQKKVDRAISLIRHAVKDKTVEVAYSGGKDSDVILELTKMAGVKYRAIYKNTTIDPPGTIKHCKDKGVEIVRPKYDFYTLVAKNGLPNGKYRFCCRYLKEYKILDTCIQGVRRCESTARSKRYSESDPVVCRMYSKTEHVNVILPVLSWANRDVVEFVTKRNIQCHPLYYDEQGKFHVERRLGCIGCPLASDRNVGHYQRHPRHLRAFTRAVKAYWETHLNGVVKKYISPYGHIARNLFFDSDIDFFTASSTDLYGGECDWKDRLEEYFKIKLP